MSLRPIKNHVQAVRQNKGILKTDQIELVGRTTAPSDSDLANSRIYYNSSSDILYARIGGTFQNLASAGSSGISGWDSIYDLDKSMTISSTTVTWTLTHASNDGLTLAASSAAASATAAILQFANSGSPRDIQGTSNSWYITSAGVVYTTGAVTCADIVRYGATGNQNFAIDAKGSGTLVLQGTATGAITLTRAVTATASLTITGSASTEVFTITDGDANVDDGSLTVTDSDNAATVVITNATATTGADQVTMTFDELTTSNALTITADKITDGSILYLDNGGATITAGTGFFINCNDGGVSDFTVSLDGATTITSAVNSTIALTVVGAQTNENMVVLTSSGVTASAKASLLLNPSGNIADNGTILRIAPSGTTVAGSKAISIVGTGKDIMAIEADVDVTDEHGIALTGSGALSGASMLYVSTDATPAAASDMIVQFKSAMTPTGQGIILNLYGTGNTVSALTTDTDNTTTNAVEITGSGALNAGHMLFVETDATPNAASDSLVQFKMNTTPAGSGILLDLYGTGKTVTGLQSDTDNTTTDAVKITGSGALNAGHLLFVETDATPNAVTDSIVQFKMNTTPAGQGILLDLYGTGKTVTALQTDTDNTTTNAVAVTGSGALNAGHMLYVATDATPSAATDSIVQFKMNTTPAGSGILLDLYGTGKTVTGLQSDTDNTTTHAIKVTGSGALNAGNMLYIETDATPNAATDSMVMFKMNTTPAGQGILLNLYGTGKTVTGLKSDTDNTTTHAVHIDGSGNLNAGNMLVVDNDGVPAANSDSVVHFTFTGTATNNPIVLEVDGSTTDAQCIRATSNKAAMTRAPVTIDQSSTTGAIAALELDQADVDKPFMLLTGTYGAANHLTSTDKSGGTTYYLMIKTNTSTLYIPAATG